MKNRPGQKPINSKKANVSGNLPENVRFIKGQEKGVHFSGLKPLQSDAEILATLVESGLTLSEVMDFDAALGQAVALALKIGQCEAATIYETEKGADTLHGVCSRNLVLEKRKQNNPFESFRIKIDGGTIAGYVASSKQALNIDDVYHLPPEVAFSFNPHFDQMVEYRSQSMLIIPMCDTRGNVLGVLQLINRVVLGQVTSFPDSIIPFVRVLASQIGVVLRNIRYSSELKRSRIETVKQFIRASEFHDTDTGMHVERMSRYSALIYEKLGYDQSQCEILRLGAMLHDVGKICIPDRVLKKPGKLDAEEWEIMKTHSTLGYEMLAQSESPFLQIGASIALTHHEKWDGSGYPRGLAGKAIPLEGRIVAIADVFDALCSRRCYKPSWPLEEVMQNIRDSAGSHFDPELVDIFLANIGEVLRIQARFTPNSQRPKELDDVTETAVIPTKAS
jgi:HD-GYP domain-containing protein (c-di-GMP phosphodiesterase class II)